MPKSSIVTPSHPKSLLDLPYEIRQIIYAHLLVSDRDLYVGKTGSYKYEDECACPPCLAILRVSRLVHDEASPIFYGRNTFAYALCRPLDSSLSKIRHLKVLMLDFHEAFVWGWYGTAARLGADSVEFHIDKTESPRKPPRLLVLTIARAFMGTHERLKFVMKKDGQGGLDRSLNVKLMTDAHLERLQGESNEVVADVKAEMWFEEHFW